MIGRLAIGGGRLRLGLLACLMSLLPAAFASTASATPLPPQGIFEYCTLDTEMQTCVQRLEVIHQGGIQVVVTSAANTSLSSLATYAAAAHSLGMSVMWQLNAVNWWEDSPTGTDASGSFSAFASACGCDQDGPLLAYTIQWLSQLPATYGYWAGDVYDDSLDPGEKAAVASYVAQIKQQDPAHLVMIGSADDTETQQYQGVGDAIGTEIYPVTNSSLMPVSDNLSMWQAIGQEAQDAQRVATRAGKQSAFVLQAFSWGDSLADGEAIGVCSASDTPQACWSELDYPSQAEQLQLRNEVLRNAHPRLIIWYSFPGTYGDVTGNTYSIFPSGAAAAAHWRGLTAAIEAPYPGTQSSRPRSHFVGEQTLSAHADRAAPRKSTHRKRRRKHHRKRHHKKHHPAAG
jgi:hypothetical protein